jgi:hypothetical protein
MTLPKEQQQRIMQLYDFCYGLPREAERILGEENPGNTIRSGLIAKYWTEANLQPRSRTEVLEQLVKEVFKQAKGVQVQMQKYLEEKAWVVEEGKKTVRVYVGPSMAIDYARKMGLPLKKDTNHARNLTGRRQNTISRTCGISLSGEKRHRYALHGPAETY